MCGDDGITVTTDHSPRFCKRLALCLATAAVAVLIVGVMICPPVLESYILADGRLGGERARLAFYVCTILCAGVSLIGVIVSRRMWIRSSQINVKRLKMSLIAMGMTTLFALVVAEVAARVLLSPEKILSGSDFWIHRWVRTHGAGPSSNGMIPDAPVDGYDPELGWLPQANFRSEEVNTNSQGLRGPREHPFAKPDGEKRIVVIGDSFTFGFGVRDEHVYAELLDERLDARVINLGANGYGTAQQYLRLKRSGFAYQPDLVIVGHFAPDADRNVLSFRDYAKPVFRLVGNELELHNVPVPAPDDSTTHWSAPTPRVYLWTLLETTWRRVLDETRFAPKWTITQRILDEVRKLSQENDARLLLVHMPSKWKAFTSEPEGSEIILKEWANMRNVAFLNLRERFVKLPRNDRSKMYHGHWTPFGNRIVADALAQKIVSEKLLD